MTPGDRGREESVSEQNDPRIDRASRILQPFTSNDYGTSRIQRAINDAFNVLQWGKTVPEEEVEELACPKL